MRLEVAMSALSLVNHGIGSCYPNPSVGCVILDKSNNLIAAGEHQMEVDCMLNLMH